MNPRSAVLNYEAMERSKEDVFESRYMSGDESVRYRDKRISRMMAAVLAAPALLIWFLAVFVGLVNSTSDKPIPPGILPFVLLGMGLFGVLYLLLALTFAVLRTVVTERHVVVKYGLWGPTIDIDAITDCRVIDYEWTKFGGWGIRRSSDGTWAYVPSSGEVVELRYRDEDKEKRILVGAQNARALAAEIQQARQAATRRARIEMVDDESERLAEEELAAAEEEATADSKQRRLTPHQ
jgi:hypothetical protein